MLKWIALGILVGTILLLGWQMISGNQQTENDAALDAEAAHHGPR